MVSDVRTFILRGRNDAMEPPVRLFQTIIFPTPTTVTATAQLSMVSLGMANREAGTAGAVIWKVGVANRTGGTDTVDLSGSWDHNGGRFVRCVFITFALSLRLAMAAGKFTLYTHA